MFFYDFFFKTWKQIEAMHTFLKENSEAIKCIASIYS